MNSQEIEGGAGNDLIYGAHKVAGYSNVDAGPGDDKIIQGDDVYGSNIFGEGGDDIIYGGANGTYGYYHGDLSSFFRVGYAPYDENPAVGGNDKIIGGDGGDYG